ncbi:MAG TPA: hypothetical protein VGY53_03270, partial [Isosphaeraceae bacterium]|nr:hypothetical protein [Isosphaeraceae bacterium]
KIVRGKWWASYRSVLWVAALPAFAAVFLAAGAPTRPSVPLGAVPPVATVPLRTIDRVTVPMVVIGQVLIYGAAVVSLGLWLATRLERPTRAVMAAVVVFGMVTLVWPTAEEAFLMRQIDRNLSEGLAALSPVAGPIVTQMSMFSPWFGTARGVVPYAAGWLVVAALFAASLRWWTIRTFDRQMGRVEQQEREYPQPTRAAKGAAQGAA